MSGPELLSLTACAHSIGRTKGWVRYHLRRNPEGFPAVRSINGKAIYYDLAEFMAWVDNLPSHTVIRDEDEPTRDTPYDELKATTKQFLELLRAEANG